MHNHVRRTESKRDRGQVTILMLMLLGVAAVLVIALALIGEAMVHRARARTAADAIALATVTDPGAAETLTALYASRGVDVVRRDDHTLAASGPSQAAAWADLTTSEVATAPILRAIVARVEQLRAVTFTTIQWQRTSFELSANDAEIMKAMSAEFGLCHQASAAVYEFRRC